MAEQPTRKLAVILHADVVESTALVQLNETLAHQRIQDVFRRFSEIIADHEGTAHEIRGDALVAEFAKASDAISASIAFQAANSTHNVELPDELRPVVRIGIAMGEVVIADNTVTGEGVVLAQRLEQLARLGSICIQGAVYETVPKRLPFDYEYLGEREVKGFHEPVRVYAVTRRADAVTVEPGTKPLQGTTAPDFPDKPSSTAASQDKNRRLATIFAADVPSSSKEMRRDESVPLSPVDRLRTLVENRIEESQGRQFSGAGDGFLAEFASPVTAVRCGFDIQRDLVNLRRENPELPDLHIGIHLTDIMPDEEDLLVEGVKIAVSIRSVAAPGSVTISHTVFDQVKRGAYLSFKNLGLKELKNIEEPLELYRVLDELPMHSYLTSHLNRNNEPHEEQMAMPDKPSIVVLPFANISNDAEQEYFVDGFSEDLITELARFKGLFVVSRNASLQYRGQNLDLRQVARELGVAYCLEGSVRKMGQRIRITAQLINGKNGEHTWADRFDRDAGEIFDVQDELVSRIVATIADRIETGAGVAARRKRPVDMDAYDCLLRGLEFHRLGSVTREIAQEAIDWFEKAVALDPDYGRAHAWLACSIANLRPWEPLKFWWDDCLASAQKALELDDNEAEIHRIMGVLSLMQNRHEMSEKHFLRALELNPNHAYIVARTGEYYNYAGQPEKALEMVERAVRLDPFLPDYCYEEAIVAHYILENYTESLLVVDRLSRLTSRAAAYAVASAVRQKNESAILSTVEALRRIAPDFSISSFILEQPYKDKSISGQLATDLAYAGFPN